FLPKLKKLGIETVKGLLWHFPARYVDFSEIVKIKDLKINQQATVSGAIQQVKLKRTWKRRMFILEALIGDDTGSIKAIWFNARFLLPIIKKGKLINLAGKTSEDSEGSLCLSHPIYELITQNSEFNTKHTGRLVPIYWETKGLTSKGIRFLIKPILDNLEELKEPLPAVILKDHNFPEINSALKNIHFPEELKEAKSAQKRFAFEDLFLLQLVNLIARLKLSRQKAHSFQADQTEIDFSKNLFSKLPFELTHSQKKSLWEILQDLARSRPMNRLLQGDVGSGKTIVAIIAALAVARENRQSAFMAPTEVLAKQHYLTFKKFFHDFSAGVGLITSGEAKIFYGDGLESEIKKSELVKKITDNKIKIIFGTHALIQKSVKFSDLALVIIDEQHRFGVKQRAELLKNHQMIPHLLSMSATPIPRTLTLTIFGDLDLSVIDELPKGRKEIITKIVAPANRDKAYAFIRGQVKKGRQVFVICPRIEKSTDGELNANMPTSGLINKRWNEVKAVKEEYEKLKEKVFPDLRVAMLHGKMPASSKTRRGLAFGGKSKTEVMQDFKDGKTDILVSTSVVEVGVDVPNATIMMIEGADRFGLAQLYQFRGRVGRGEHQSFCFLFTDSVAKDTYRRLYSLISAKNGFELAEEDLAIRGPGEFLGGASGWAQTGIPDLAMKAAQNPDLVKSAREAA
ncbi:MAG: ATP-dependent DNA helicase RecG, partial [Patescibacteria group bacterium]